MLTAEAIIAKVVSLIAEKSVGKLAELALDKRKKACRVLTKLYFCVQTLDDVTEGFFETLNDFNDHEKPFAVLNAVNNSMHEARLATDMFIELSSELHGGLELIDPALADCCWTLCLGKFDFLHFMLSSIGWDRTQERAKLLIKAPSEKIQNADLDATYSKAKSAFSSGRNNYNPMSILDQFSTEFESIEITSTDEPTAKKLEEMILKQNLLLKDAKEKLRTVIKSNFSVEEILFESGSHPYR